MGSFPWLSLAVALGVTASTLDAQYVEPDVHVLLERSIGTSGNGFGNVVCALGDVDGDGVIDLAASDLGGGSAGRVYALSGADGSTLWTRTQPTSLLLGQALANMDWNADGVLDLVAGAPSPFFVRGRTWVFSGVDGAVLADISLSFEHFGAHVATGGDVDGDGLEDLLVGSPDEAVFLTGRVDAFRRGQPGSPILTLFGDFEFDFFGTAIAYVGDTSTPPDGRDEVAVGVGGVLGPSGKVRVFSWQLGERYTLHLPQAARDLDGGKDVDGDGLPDFAAATGGGVRVFSGVDGAPIHTLGQSEAFDTVALLADVDGDGRADIAAGASASGSGAGFGGKVYLFSGASGALLKTITSNVANRRLGADVRELGDLDGDGHGDLLVGAASFSGPLGSALVFSLAQPELVLDFETEDDFATPLVNGQHVDTEFGRLVTLTSSGPNAGLALFDSTPGGPNDPSQDRDLLVGSGNLLVLQTENFPPDANDVFPRPNDDEDGGTLGFAFELPVEPTSVRLVDLDSSDGPATIRLTDLAARQRTYTLPSRWTGDLLAGEPGQGTLALDTLAPQPGFGSDATATEASGFDGASVVRIDVTLAGSGGVDDLAVRPGAGLGASVRVRNGSGVNPLLLTASSTPRLGSPWAAALDCAGLGAGLAVLEVRRLPSAGTRTPFGEVLVGGALLLRRILPIGAQASTLSLDIPFDLSLCGLDVHVQGACHGSATTRGKLRAGRHTLSNALDLQLGF